MKTSKFDVLVALYIFGIMVAELMGAKTMQLTQFSWLHLHASVAIFVMPLLFTITDVVNEVYGRERAKRLVRIGLMIVTLQLFTSLLFTALPASARFAGSEGAYDSIFGTSVRFAIAALLAFGISELMDVFIFAKLRERMGKRGLWVRNNVSNFVSQFFDSTVFVVAAFYVFGDPFGANASFLISIILPYWLIRCALSLAETPLVYLGVRWLKPQKKAALGPIEAAGSEA
ncbi:MAG: queuosine precursor transporter [Candidatus Saccharimonadales bacterium]